MTQHAHAPLVPSLSESHSRVWLGTAFAVLTVLIWSGYFLSLRAGVLSPLPTRELSLIRYTLPGLLLLPVFLSSLSVYRAQAVWVLGAIMLCSGLGFFLITLIGTRQTNVLLGSTLSPGAAPLFVTFIAVVFFKEKLAPKRLLGLTVIASGIGVFVLQATLTFNAQTLAGIALFLLAAFIWAVFTVAVRLSTLKPIQIAALVTVPNGLLVLLWVLLTGAAIDFSSVGVPALLTQVVMQGLLVGICSGVVYSAAIARLGAEKTSAIGSATPAVASVLALFIFGESITVLSALGVILVMAGVVISSRVK